MIVCVSGGFDPLHIGHIDLLRSAARMGDVTVILNSDEWLGRKKGYRLMSWEDRAEILRSIKYVSKVIPVDDSDDTVCEALASFRPDLFLNAGDRVSPNDAENKICTELNIGQAFDYSGKIRSSTKIIDSVRSI